MSALQTEFDFDAARPDVLEPVAARDGRAATSAMGYRAGLSAEAQVAADYARRGFAIVAQRWRGRCGEIDLILQDGDGLIFVEVKKSASYDRALAALSPRQIGRLWRAAEEYLDRMPKGAMTEVRFDVALVDSVGAIRVIENAFAP